MKQDTLTEPRLSLKARFRKGIIENRAFMVFFWFSLANMIGFPLAMSVFFKPDYSESSMRIGILAVSVGLPIIALILGVLGYLPGTRKKQ